MDIRSIMRRHEANPILRPEDMPFNCYTVMNAGVTKFNGKILLLLRAEDMARVTRFYVATSDDGVNFDVNREPIDYPLGETELLLGGGNRFDMRITEIDGRYIIFHAVWLEKYGCTIATVETEDFVHFRQTTRLSEPSNRNAVLFPEKIDGLYARIDRPQNMSENGNMWISYSPDLEFWGRSLPLMYDVPGWGKIKTGAGAIPIKTDEGWLLIYHGVGFTCSANNYYLSAMLLDLNDPSKVIAAPASFILAAERDYECMGQTPNVVFTGGAIEMPDGTLNVYYGGADTCMCVAQTTVKELVEFCKTCE